MASKRKRSKPPRARAAASGATPVNESDAAAGAPSRPVMVKATSLAKAAAVFKTFSLSKHRGQVPPPTHVPRGASAASVQRQVITRRLEQLREVPVPSDGMSLSVRPATLEALPSYNPDSGTVGATDMLGLLGRLMRGTEFYAQGHPTVTRTALQARVKRIIANLPQGVTE